MNARSDPGVAKAVEPGIEPANPGKLPRAMLEMNGDAEPYAFTLWKMFAKPIPPGKPFCVTFTKSTFNFKPGAASGLKTKPIERDHASLGFSSGLLPSAALKVMPLMPNADWMMPEPPVRVPVGPNIAKSVGAVKARE